MSATTLTTAQPKKAPKNTNLYRKKRVKKWKYGAESDFALVVKNPDGWVTFYSHDTTSKYKAKGGSADRTEAEKIQKLQLLLEKGGTRGQRIDPEFAAIIPNGGKIKDAVSIYRPGKGWFPAEWRDYVKNAEFKIWLAANPAKKISNVTIIFSESPDFEAFCNKMINICPHILERYVDQDGEVPKSVLICLYLSYTARKQGESGNYCRAYIYRSGTDTPFLRVNLRTGVMSEQGTSAWAPASLFYTL